jgi:hypothetical protein
VDNLLSASPKKEEVVVDNTVMADRVDDVCSPDTLVEEE